MPKIPKTCPSSKHPLEDDGPLLADGFEKAFMGYVEQFNTTLACYDYDKCIEIMVKRDGMAEDEALEYMSYNVTGSWMGKYTPVFFHKMKLKEFNEMCDDL
jgi:hypothetical protein